MAGENTGTSTEQLSHSWDFSRSLGSKKAWHYLVHVVLPSLSSFFFLLKPTCKL